MKHYNVVLLSKSYVIHEREIEGRKAAIEAAKYLLSDSYARACESSHESLQTEKVEVRTEDGTVVWDKYLEGKGNA